MKVLIIQSDGQHKGQDGFCPNWYMRECYGISYAFEQLGHSTNIWGLRHNNFNEVPKDEYDLVLLAEQYEFNWVPNLLDFHKAKKVQWIVDLHYQGAEKYSKFTNQSDIVLHATRKLAGKYKEMHHESIRHFWFPNAVDSRIYHGQGLRQTYKRENIVFVGSDHASRRSYIEGLKKDVGLKSYFLTGNDMINKISESEFSFNKNISCDINYRTFETIGIGTVLITNYDEDLIELGFKDGENCILYYDYDDCVSKIKNMQGKNTKDMAIAGFELSKKNTYVERIKVLLESL